jgi:outer membrane murein-binding lipoprotein Lpp
MGIRRALCTGITVSALIMQGCASNARVEKLEAKVDRALAAQAQTERQLRPLQEDSYWETAAAYELLTGKKPEERMTQMAMMSAISDSVAAMDDINKAVSAYRTLKDRAGFKQKEAAAGIRQKHLIGKVEGKTELNEVILEVKTYAEATGAAVHASENGKVIHVKGGFGAATIYQDAEGNYRELKLAELLGGETGVSSANFTKLSKAAALEQQITNATSIYEKMALLLKGVQEGYKQTGEAKTALEQYLATPQGNAEKATVIVRFKKEGKTYEARTRVSIPAAMAAGALGDREAMCVLAGQEQACSVQSLWIMLNKGVIKPGRTDFRRALVYENCTAKYHGGE